MKLQELLDRIETTYNLRYRIMQGKSNDYATDDVLSNFKRMASICAIWNINPEYSAADAAMFLLCLKLDRLNNLKNGKPISNESLWDTIVDAHNYLDLFLVNWEEFHATKT